MVTNTIKLHTTGFYLYEILEKSWAIVTEDILVDAWEWGSRNEVDCKGARGKFLVWENNFKSWFRWWLHTYIYCQNLLTFALKSLNFVKSKLYLNKI